MEFACSHVVCNWRPEMLASESFTPAHRLSVSEHEYDNRVNVIPPTVPSMVPPPLPPRKYGSKKPPRPGVPPPLPPPQSSPLPPSNSAPLPPLLPPPKSAPLPPLLPPPQSAPLPPPKPPNIPPPPPPKGHRESKLRANVNVVSLHIGRLVDISKASGVQTSQTPVHCGKCSAALSSLSSVQNKQGTQVWSCEFCGEQNAVAVKPPRRSLGAGPRLRGRDVVYGSAHTDDDYQNLEDSLVLFCVDVSGSMSVTAEVTPGNSMRSPTYVSRLQSIQDALQRALSFLLQTSPHRRVALVTFNDEVVIYGDGSGLPVTLRDWSLMDYDHIWQLGVRSSTPHCLAESFQHLSQRVKELRDHGATALGPAALVSVAMASRYEGSKVVLCTDGRANVGLGELEQGPAPSAAPYFYSQLAQQAANSGVIVSVMTFEGTDCRLAEVGRLADQTGGRVNIVNIGTVATEIQSALADNILATGVTATLLAPDGVYFPYEEESMFKLVRRIGNVPEGLEVTFQFAVKPESVEGFMRRDRLPFQLQLRFRTRDHQSVTRIVTEQRRVTTSSWVWAGSLNRSVLGVHCAQLCARLSMEGRLAEAKLQLRAQQELLTGISEQRPIPKEENVYGNWISTMTTICDDLTATDTQGGKTMKQLQASQSSPVLSDEAAMVFYQMKRASSVSSSSSSEQADMLAL